MAREDDARKDYPELLADLADQVGLKLAESGVDVGKAAEIGWAVAEHVREHWSGQSLYLSKGERYRLSVRDRKIFAAFNGRNHAELARQHGLTVMRIYQIVKIARAELIAKQQTTLF